MYTLIIHFKLFIEYLCTEKHDPHNTDKETLIELACVKFMGDCEYGYNYVTAVSALAFNNAHITRTFTVSNKIVGSNGLTIPKTIGYRELCRNLIYQCYTNYDDCVVEN